MSKVSKFHYIHGRFKVLKCTREYIRVYYMEHVWNHHNVRYSLRYILYAWISISQDLTLVYKLPYAQDNFASFTLQSHSIKSSQLNKAYCVTIHWCVSAISRTLVNKLIPREWGVYSLKYNICSSYGCTLLISLLALHKITYRVWVLWIRD